ncbi:MAG: type II secretion system protein GspC [Gammaproteobacteria bacterium]
MNMATIALTQQSLQHRLRAVSGSPLLIPAVNFLLIMWLAWLLARLSWAVLATQQETVANNVTGVTTSVVQPSRQPVYNGAKIASWHLMGEAKEPVKRVAPVKKAPTSAPDTRLNLTLSGIFATEEGGNALAIIGEPRGGEESYSVGDPVPGGASLYEVHADRVILERNGGYETLRLPQNRTSRNGSSNTRGRSSQSRPSARSRSPQGKRNQALGKYRDRIKKNPTSFTDYVRPVPVRENGKFVGFRLQEGNTAGALDDLGLQAGDVVTQINGVVLDSPSKGMQAMRSLNNSGSNINLTVMRSGGEISLNFALPTQ